MTINTGGKMQLLKNFTKKNLILLSFVIFIYYIKYANYVNHPLFSFSYDQRWHSRK